MRRSKIIINSTMAALISTLVLTTVSILFLMFTSGQGFRGKRTGLFDAVFFEVTPKDDDVLGLSLGVNNVVPLLIIWAVLTIIILGTYFSYKVLSRYKETLQENSAEQTHEKPDALTP